MFRSRFGQFLLAVGILAALYVALSVYTDYAPDVLGILRQLAQPGWTMFGG